MLLDTGASLTARSSSKRLPLHMALTLRQSKKDEDKKGMNNAKTKIISFLIESVGSRSGDPLLDPLLLSELDPENNRAPLHSVLSMKDNDSR